MTSELHTNLATHEQATDDHSICGGWIVLTETAPVGQGPWHWHAAAAGGTYNSDLPLLPFRNTQGWAGTLSQARNAYHDALEHLSHEDV